MRQIRSLTASLFILPWLVVSIASADQPRVAPGLVEEGHEVRLDRPFEVGARHRVQVSARVERSYDVGLALVPGQPGANFEIDRVFSVDLEAVREVVAVDTLGRPTEELYTLARCTRAGKNGSPKVLLPPGSVLTASLALDGTTRLELRGARLPRKARKALEAVIELAGGASRDALFATTVPHRLGESWSVQPDILAEELERQGATVSPSDIAGRATLVALRRVDGIEVLEVRGQVEGRNITVPGQTPGQSPPATVRMSFSGLYPTDPNRPPSRERIETEIHGAVEGGDAESGVAGSLGLHEKVVLTRTVEPVE
jgi:hypothetical protein